MMINLPIVRVDRDIMARFLPPSLYSQLVRGKQLPQAVATHTPYIPMALAYMPPTQPLSELSMMPPRPQSATNVLIDGLVWSPELPTCMAKLTNGDTSFLDRLLVSATTIQVLFEDDNYTYAELANNPQGFRGSDILQIVTDLYNRDVYEHGPDSTGKVKDVLGNRRNCTRLAINPNRSSSLWASIDVYFY